MSEEQRSNEPVDDWGGPYVQAATFCDQVIEGKDGTLTIVRLVDRFSATVVGTDPESASLPEFRGTLVIMLKSGKAQGSHRLHITVENPIGLTKPTAIDLTVFIEGQERGANLIIPMAAQFEEEGLYWFNVMLGNRLLSRVPLRVMVQRQRVSVGAM